MTRAERYRLVLWTQTLSDEELEEEYYKAVFKSLGSEAEEMYELGYDIQDIIEQERYEKDLIKTAHILGKICEERGIKLWEEGE